MAKQELQDIVGNQNILSSDEVLEEFSKDLSFTPRLRPKQIVKVNSTAEVQALIKWANETSTPLIPVSSGPPHSRGDTVPTAGGSIIVDLSGMNKILRIDRKNRVAMIEPGVTFSELIPALAKAGLKLNLPLLPRANKSVIGSMLEREPVIMPLYQWDAIDPLTCIEVVFGTGDLFRTGSAAGPGSLEDQWRAGQAQVNPMGPGQSDFARVVQGAQGTMGIVTWSTVRCEVLPSLEKPFLIGADRYDKLSEFVYRMQWYKAGEECLILNNVGVAAILARSSEEYENLKNSLPAWILLFVLAGLEEYYPEEKVAYQEETLMEEAKRQGLSLVSAVGGVSANEMLRTVSKPAEEPHWKLRQKGSCQDIFCLTNLDKVEALAKVMYEKAEKYGYPISDMGVYVQPMVQGTSCHLEFDLFYNPRNIKEAGKIQGLYAEAAEALMNAGGFFNRPYGLVADLAYRRDAETTASLRKVKGILDPNNVMNAGKLCF